MNLYKILILLFFSLSTLFANIKLTIPSNTIVKNESFIFTIEAFGNKIKFPDISEIDGLDVQEISNSTSTNIINGQITKRIKKAYSFNPTNDFILPSFEAVIDGKNYYTKEEKITLQKASKTKSDVFDLTIKTNTNEFYIGENFILTLIFKYKKDAQVNNLYLEKPNFENFFYKQIDDTKNYEEGEFQVLEIKFLMFAVKEGILKIDPIKINTEIIDNTAYSYSIFSSKKNETIYSNELNFNIKSLPENIKLIGSFDIETSVDKKKVKRGEAVSYKLRISGIGNIDDINNIKLPINDVTIYENKPLRKTGIVNNEYIGNYEKVFSIIANKSFTIPSIPLEYFDKDLKKIVLKQSKKFDIEVLEEELKKEVVLEKASNDIIKVETPKEIIKIVEKSSALDRIVFFSLGIITSLLIMSLYFYVITLKRKKYEYIKPLSKKVKASKTKEELIKILAIYIKIDLRLDKLIFELEKTNDIISLKKEIIKVLKELNL